MWQSLRGWARRLKQEVVAVYLAARDRRTPWCAKMFAAATAAYALSPIDLIPDFIPVLGYLDDVILVPAGIWLTVRLIPVDLMMEYRSLAAAIAIRPTSRFAAAVIVTIWIGTIAAAGWLMAPRIISALGN